jgi:hypothetical protein
MQNDSFPIAVLISGRGSNLMAVLGHFSEGRALYEAGDWDRRSTTTVLCANVALYQFRWMLFWLKLIGRLSLTNISKKEDGHMA